MNIVPERLLELRNERNQAQAELERFLLEQYPIDSMEKSLGRRAREQAVVEIEEQMRHLALDSPE